MAPDGIEPVIPPISTRSKKLPCDAALNRQRNRIERFFNKLKQFRRVATRYDKLRHTFFSALCLVTAFLIAKNSWTLPSACHALLKDSCAEGRRPANVAA